MDVKFITVTRDLVDCIPITDGQVIAVKDSDDFFYDMCEQRKHVGASVWEGVSSDPYERLFITDANISIIQFKPSGGTDVTFSFSSKKNEIDGVAGDLLPDVTMPTTTRSGYEFLGWYDALNINGDAVETLPAKFPRGKTIYYASWKQKK